MCASTAAAGNAEPLTEYGSTAAADAVLAAALVLKDLIKVEGPHEGWRVCNQCTITRCYCADCRTQTIQTIT